MKQHLVMIVGMFYPQPSPTGKCAEAYVDLLKDQYDIYNIDAASADDVIKDLLSDSDTTIELTAADDLEELGFDTKKVSKVEIKADEDTGNKTIKLNKIFVTHNLFSPLPVFLFFSYFL